MQQIVERNDNPLQQVNQKELYTRWIKVDYDTFNKHYKFEPGFPHIEIVPGDPPNKWRYIPRACLDWVIKNKQVNY
ncbi:hypothetical protein [Furfurilactobacillus milii]|uniref:Uncharacterized protein n=1 Tax=Furfurilactobacillus milii TaxID=2888272 RepID=A0ABT6DCG5_9LACO|nr:hypothetical protein [Furfurilactobacillus milii]QLE66964.1 hypothetical protein LROSL2_1614 [Furfurilactobacillus rossiae]MCF6161974.1 hypothetical protein [Furfurilactobacillus milii]MCF6164354.1 hypothetical protein [Furfurilactobacillus milii]MDF9914842.1 hypothetical protein [Furfurilactobacillus milii]QLE69394.1 hypothetical protein LROSL3_1615 [Furfurilactobacillus rossiae]